MRGGRVHASGLVLGAALTAAAVSSVSAAQTERFVFSELKASRLRYGSPEEAPSAGDRAKAFFRASLRVGARFRLAPDSDGVDLALDPIELSFGAFTTSLDANRIVTVEDNGAVVLRFAGRGLNDVGRVFLKQTGSRFRMRIRATRLAIPMPDRLTIRIGNDVGQLDVRTNLAVAPEALVQGLLSWARTGRDGEAAVVRAPCGGGACRASTDERGRFSVSSKEGTGVLTIRAHGRDQRVLSRIFRRAYVRPGTNDLGMVVLPELADAAELTVAGGQQSGGAVLSYPDAGPPQATLAIAAGALLERVEAGADPVAPVRISLAPIPPELLPVPMPPGVATAGAWAVEPAGVEVTPCADVVLHGPSTGLPDGTSVTLYLLSREAGGWVPEATGLIEDDGTTIRAPGALCELTSFFVACEPALTSVEASVTYRGAPIANVPVVVAGRSTLTSAADRQRVNLRVPAVSAGCASAPDTLTAHAALPLLPGHGFLTGSSAPAVVDVGGRTNLGEIALSLCGDGVADGDEACDGEDLRGLACVDFGYADGDLACTATCALDRSDCKTCGDGVTDPGEECDGADDDLCPGACRSSCSCPPVCGDGVRNQPTEACDGADDGLCPAACDERCQCPPSVTTTTLPPEICPVAFELTPRARARSLTGATALEIGFSGLGHDRDLAGGHPLTVAVDCQGLGPVCGDCAITGLQPVRGRCSQDSSRACDALNAPDDDHCDGRRCDVFFAPPLHNMWGGGPSCFVERLAGDVAGVIDNGTGDSHLTLDLAADLYIGVSPTQPCPICAGDPHPNDGFLEGTCIGGESDGLDCDANGDDPTFGPTSFDCLPGAGMLGASLPLTRRLELDSDGIEVPFGLPCDFPIDDRACPCAVCAGDASVACSSDQDCVDAGTSGPCSGRGSGALRKPNTCEDYSCNDVGDGVHGRCATGPDETYCDGVLFAHGTPFLPCLSNADCRAANEACGGDCGECTVVKRRRCFLDPILGEGMALPNVAVLSDVRCAAPGVSPALDQVGGLPGPERVTIEMGLKRLWETSFQELPRTPRRSRRR